MPYRLNNNARHCAYDAMRPLDVAASLLVDTCCALHMVGARRTVADSCCIMNPRSSYCNHQGSVLYAIQAVEKHVTGAGTVHCPMYAAQHSACAFRQVVRRFPLQYKHQQPSLVRSVRCGTRHSSWVLVGFGCMCCIEEEWRFAR